MTITRNHNNITPSPHFHSSLKYDLNYDGPLKCIDNNNNDSRNDALLFNTSTKPTPIKVNRHQRKISKKHVRFASTKKVVFVRKTTQDLQHSWYNINEYRNFDIDRKRTVAVYNNYDNNDSMQSSNINNYRTLEESGDITIKGLEHQLSYEHAMARKYTTKHHSYCVLKQQYDNRYVYGIWYDDESLRHVSELFSKSQLHRAYIRASLID